MDKHEIRYNYLHLIASIWFDLFETIHNQNKDLNFENNDTELHKILSNHTLVGELVGIESFQQILNYPSKSLIFSSLIDNENSSESCLPYEKCVEFCSKWKLHCIKMNSVGFYSTKDELKEATLNLYHEATSGSLNDFEEGVIAMLILRNSSEPSKDKVLS